MLENLLQCLHRSAAILAALVTALNIEVPTAQIPAQSRKDEIRLRQQMELTEDLQTFIRLGTELELERLDLDRFDVTAAQVDALYEQMMNTAQLLWYLEPGWSTALGEDGTVAGLWPQYLDPAEYSRIRYEKAAASALEEAVHPGMSELQIALSLHDYLAVHCAYDLELERSTEYDVLIHGSAVCQGYAEAYMDLMTRAGVECIIVTSEEMNHCWNQVKLGEQWYNVDVTWDDPTPDRVGMASHSVFLISDETMHTAEFGYYGWESPNTCTDTGYESGWFWADSISPVVYADADTCYLIRIGENGYSILQRDEETGTETRLARMDFKYPDALFRGEQRMHFYTCGLSLADGGLYFTDVHQVRRLDLATGEVTPVYEHDVSETRRVLVGSFLDGGTLYLSMMDSKGVSYDTQIPLPEA